MSKATDYSSQSALLSEIGKTIRETEPRDATTTYLDAIDYIEHLIREWKADA